MWESEKDDMALGAKQSRDISTYNVPREWWGRHFTFIIGGLNLPLDRSLAVLTL